LNELHSIDIKTPAVTDFQVFPVAGHDSMLLNLSGAHCPNFTRNILILGDSHGHVGVGESIQPNTCSKPDNMVKLKQLLDDLGAERLA
jgi:L-alanine-DL-glutamate epimerase-like enolase superfamily enzyme